MSKDYGLFLFFLRLLFIKENKTCQVNECSASLCKERCKSLGSLKPSLWYESQLSGASILCFPILSLLRVHHCGSDCSGWYLNGGHPIFVLSSLRTQRPGSYNMMAWWLQYPFFTDMVGNIFSLRRAWLTWCLLLGGQAAGNTTEPQLLTHENLFRSRPQLLFCPLHGFQNTQKFLLAISPLVIKLFLPRIPCILIPLLMFGQALLFLSRVLCVTQASLTWEDQDPFPQLESTSLPAPDT